MAGPIPVGGAGGVSLAVGPDPTVSAFPMVNTINLGGQTLPGKWTLHKAERLFGWQIKQAYGLSGAFIVPKGDPLLVAEFRGEFWAQADYLLYKQMREILFAKAVVNGPGGTTTLALGIAHPEVNGLGCYAVVCGHHGAAIDRGGGLWEARVELIEFRPYLLALPQPTQKIPAEKQAPPIANSANSAQIAKLQAEAAALLTPVAR
jgi:hypothetical protein